MPEPAPLLVVFASETGTSQEAAEQVAREACARRYAVTVADAASVSLEALRSARRVLFLVSTAGQGEAPASLRPLWRALLRRSLGPDTLRGLDASVFGFGDSGYPGYNTAAKKLWRRLEALGACLLGDLGLGDGAAPLGPEPALATWADALWPLLRARAPAPAGFVDPPSGTPAPPPPPRVRVSLLPPPPLSPLPPTAADDDGTELLAACAACDALEEALRGRGALLLPPTQLLRLTAQRDLSSPSALPRRVVEVSLSSVDGSPLGCSPGWVVWLRRVDSASAAAALCSRLGLDPRAIAEVAVPPPPYGAPSDTQNTAPTVFRAPLRALLRGCVDTSAPPSPALLAALSRGCDASTDAGRRAGGRLALFASPDGRAERLRYVASESRGLSHILADFPETLPDLGELLQWGPRCRARGFSAASDSSTSGDAAVHLAVARVAWTTPLGAARTGALSGALCSPASLGTLFAGCVAPGTLTAPPLSAPLLLIAPGTGVASMRAFIQARSAAEKDAAAVAAGVGGRAHAHMCGPTALFFGARSPDTDALFHDEWTAAARPGGVLCPARGGGYFPCWSRPTQPDASKTYVQHSIARHAQLVAALLASDGAAVRVAGRARGGFAHDVRAALVAALAQHGGGAPCDAEARVRRLEAAGAYQVEVWG